MVPQPFHQLVDIAQEGADLIVPLVPGEGLPVLVAVQHALKGVPHHIQGPEDHTGHAAGHQEGHHQGHQGRGEEAAGAV